MLAATQQTLERFWLAFVGRNLWVVAQKLVKTRLARRLMR